MICLKQGCDVGHRATQNQCLQGFKEKKPTMSKGGQYRYLFWDLQQ